MEERGEGFCNVSASFGVLFSDFGYSKRSEPEFEPKYVRNTFGLNCEFSSFSVRALSVRLLVLSQELTEHERIREADEPDGRGAREREDGELTSRVACAEKFRKAVAKLEKNSSERTSREGELVRSGAKGRLLTALDLLEGHAAVESKPVKRSCST